jgi:hypothetical protein
MLMDYAACNPLSIIRYHASGMVLYVHSDTSYLCKTRARSRRAGHFFLSDIPVDPAEPPAVIPTLNGPIHTMCKIMLSSLAQLPKLRLELGIQTDKMRRLSSPPSLSLATHNHQHQYKLTIPLRKGLPTAP